MVFTVYIIISYKFNTLNDKIDYNKMKNMKNKKNFLNIS